MKKLAIVLTLTAACEAGIGPDPTSSSSNNTNNTTSSSNGGSTSSSGGGGSNNVGGSGGSNGEGGSNSAGGSNGNGGGMPGGGYESGTRIKERYLMGQDGSRHHLGWFDTEKGVECSWRPIGGSTRCLPNGKFWSSYYSDAACSQRILVLPTTCSTAAEYALVGDVCGTDTQVFAVGAETNPPLVYIKAGSTCANIGKPADSVFKALGSEIPGSEFVSASVSTEQ